MGQVLPFLSQEHQQQVATAVERAKQVTMAELNTVIGVSISIVLECYKGNKKESQTTTTTAAAARHLLSAAIVAIMSSEANVPDSRTCSI